MGHDIAKKLDIRIVAYSCTKVEKLMMNKCAKFQSNMSMDFENI
jgi:hypothetical protein